MLIYLLEEFFARSTTRSNSEVHQETAETNWSDDAPVPLAALEMLCWSPFSPFPMATIGNETMILANARVLAASRVSSLWAPYAFSLKNGGKREVKLPMILFLSHLLFTTQV